MFLVLVSQSLLVVTWAENCLVYDACITTFEADPPLYVGFGTAQRFVDLTSRYPSDLAK
jgi:hypothetical protein